MISVGANINPTSGVDAPERRYPRKLLSISAKRLLRSHIAIDWQSGAGWGMTAEYTTHKDSTKKKCTLAYVFLQDSTFPMRDR
jgi:hypothetical protein